MTWATSGGSTNAAAIDFAQLRMDRRRRLLDAMATHDLDVLILGRPADIAYATGARQLWTAGTRAFGPACILVAATGHAHLLSVSDDGVPIEISHDDLFGLFWNPANLVASLGAIRGLGAARRVGTGSLSPGFPRLVQALAPRAEVVDGTPAIWAARAVKTSAEMACITTATAIAESALTAMIDILRPGVTRRDLLVAYLERIALLGCPTPPTEGVVGLGRLATDRRITDGELVMLDPGAIFGGYESGVGRTWVAGPHPVSDAQFDLASRCKVAREIVLSACRAGATGAEVRRAWHSTGEADPPVPLVYGIGLGVEPPVVDGDIGGDAVLLAGAVLSVTSYVAADDAGEYLERDVVVVGEDGAEVLSRYGRGPAGQGA